MASSSFSGENLGTQVAVNNGQIYFSSGSDRESSQERLDKAVLRSLAFPQMLDRRDTIEARHSNTCQWILEQEKYKSWKSQPRGLLWIKGKPGAGKSTLMVFLYERLKESDANQGIQLDFFFTARGTELQRTPLGMLRSLLNQIFDRDASVRPQVRETYEERCRQFGDNECTWQWPQRVLEELLTGAILASASRQLVTVFVDALDETGAECAQDLAAYFHRLLDRAGERNATVRICISCRHYPIVGQSRAIEVYVEKHNYKDIATYIKDILADIDVEEDPYASEDQREMLLDQLIKQSNGVFQWARLIVPLTRRRLLEGESFDNIGFWLREVPAGLENVYLYILKEVIEPRNLDQSFLLFQWVCLAERPLTVTEMRYALAAKNVQITRSSVIWEEIHGFVQSNERMRRWIKTLSGGLAEVVSSRDPIGRDLCEIVQVVHQSVNDFLRAKGLAVLGAHGIGASFSPIRQDNILLQCQATLYRSCLVYLATLCMRKNILDLYQRLEDSSSRLRQNCPFIAYATENLFVHAEKSAESRVTVLQNEQDILQQVISQWIWIYHIMGAFFDNPKRPSKGSTIIHIAAAANLVDLIESASLNSENVAKEDEGGSTPLHSAAKHGHITGGSILLEKGADCEAKDRQGRTPLTVAASFGHVEFVEWLLNKGVKIQTTIGRGESALYAAAYIGKSQVVQVLLNAGADVNAQGGSYGNALQAAAATFALPGERSKVVQKLLDAGADVNVQGGYFGNALQAAAYVQSSEVVQILLNAGADVDAQGGYYGNALQAAAKGRNKGRSKGRSKGRTCEVVQMLLNAGADVNAQGGHFGNALQAAALVQSSEVVQILLNADADVNAQGGKFGNALQAAAEGQSCEVVQILLDAGADVNAQGGHFGNALQAAVKGQSSEVVQILLDAGADVNAQCNEGGSTVLAAVQMSKFDRVSMLLHAGADVILADKLGRTPLHIAASRDMLDLLNQFPLLASSVNNRDSFLHTPLRVAISLGHIEFAMKLLRLGANPSLSDGYGRNALDWALGNKSLVHHIQMNCPSIVVTPHENQELNVRQSIFQISEMFLSSEPSNPWPLLRQLGCYLLFLNNLDNAAPLFRLPFLLSGAWRIKCGGCRCLLKTSYFTCRICANNNLCSSCVQYYPCPSRSHPNQEHEMLEVLNLPGKSELAISSPEQLTSFLSNLILEFSTPNTSKAETGSADEPVSCPTSKKAALDSKASLSRKAMFYAFLFGLSAVLLRYWYLQDVRHV